MEKQATLSNDRKHRYWLERTWDKTKPPQVFVMLNPSTADSYEDDPTIRRCIDFAKREGAGSLVVVNIFAYRATDPKELDYLYHNEAIGKNNQVYINDAIKNAIIHKRPIICAWGSKKIATQVGCDFVAWANLHGAVTKCLGVTKSGAPKHPLYLSKETELIPFGEWSASKNDNASPGKTGVAHEGNAK